MEPSDSGPGQEQPPEQSLGLSPSSKGRQRKKNSKYLDYETDYGLDAEGLEEKHPSKSQRGEKASPKKTPARGQKPESGSQRTASEQKDAPAPESDEKPSEETPKRMLRARKTPAPKTPAPKTPAPKTPAPKTPAPKTPAPKTPAPKTPAPKTPAPKTPAPKAPAPKTPAPKTPAPKAPAPKTPAPKTPAPKTPAPKAPAPKTPAAGGAAEGVQQENRTPQSKRKHGRKQRNQDATPVSEPPRGEDQGQPPIGEERPGERPRRGAAKAALKYLHSLAKDMFHHKSEAFGSQPGAKSEVTGSARKTSSRTKATKGQKRKRPDFDSDAPDDEDFVPGGEEEEEEEEGELDETEDEETAESLDLDSDVRRGGSRPAVSHSRNSKSSNNFKHRTGFSMNTMKVVWECMGTTKKFREERHSSWVFPDWVPSTSAWLRVPQRDVDTYLPEEPRSAAFRVSREGLRKEETPLRRLDRFGSVPVHPERWDALLFAGGPVWAMEWCPTPDGVPATQFIALSCHRGMDEQHYVNRTYTGPGLVQLWDVGQLEYDTRPQSQPSLAYALAQDKGFIWQLKWCPAGGWEPPTSGRKAPLLPRLGLLAVATSNGVVTIYSLPHPEALNSSNQLSDSENSSQQLPIYKAKGLVTLKLGAFKAPRLERSGQVLCMDWLPEKPHDVIVIGFYDGTVGLWNLSTKSSLLRIRESDASLSLLPYRCLLAHDHAVRALAFCPASRHLLVTAGEDRYVKTWDLRRLYDPITVQKRYLTNEIYWPLIGPGIILAQDCAYAPRLQGVHYLDHLFNSFFAIPRATTVWSLSYTDWMNSVVASDSFGEVIFAVLPELNCFPPYAKRTLERRFPVYVTSVLPDDKPGDHQTAGGAEEGAVKAQEGSAREDSDAPSDKGNKHVNGNDGGGEGETRPSQPLETYKEALKRCCLQQEDFDLRSFVGMERRTLWKRMKTTEIGAKLDTDKMSIAALHKVRFNPNMNCHVWVVSGGQTGLVKLNCLRGMISSQSKTIVGDGQTQSDELHSTNEQKGVTDEL